MPRCYRRFNVLTTQSLLEFIGPCNLLRRKYWCASRGAYGLEKWENNCKMFKEVELSSKQIWQVAVFTGCNALSAVEDAENGQPPKKHYGCFGL